MKLSFPGFRKRRNAAVIDKIYGEIVASARRPRFYADMGVPDTPLGRFEMLSLHMFLLFERARRTDDKAVQDIVQELTDEFFKDVDHSLRELGIGDMGVPKRMKKLARMFYGRCQSYGAALAAGDMAALAAAMQRNIRPDIPADRPWEGAAPLAEYAAFAARALAAEDDGAIVSGAVAFPGMQPSAAMEGSR